jgi:hypothetical protein
MPLRSGVDRNGYAMKSREFYQLVDRALAPECKRLGFSRRRGTVSLWHVPLPTGTFFYECSKSLRSSYIPYLGGKFLVKCHLTPSPDPKAREFGSYISYMEFFSDADLEAMGTIRNRVVQKIIDQRPPDEVDRLMLETHTPSLKSNIGRLTRRNQAFPEPYLDAEDVTAWAEFLASRLEQTLVGVREKRTEDGARPLP